MADFTALKTAIQNAIKQNGNEEITGNLLQEVLLAIVTTLGDGSINDLVTALGSEATTRSQADGTLQQNIDAEAQARQQAVSAEAQARSNADTALGGRIDGVIESINAINAAIGNGYVYAGIATPSSIPTTGKVFYLALTAGTYTNFGNIAVTQGINILKYNGSAWSLDAFVGIDDAPTQGSNNLIKSGGAFDFVMKNGSAFDLSAYNNGTTYADLSAALAALNSLPSAYKKGGMSLKYVQSSDNKYVQWRLMANSFSTDVTQWQGVDEKPTVGSKNLVESNKLGYIIEDLTTTKNSTQTYAATSAITDYLFDWGVENGSTLYYDFLNASLRGIHIIGKLADGTVETILENIFNKTGNKTVTKDYIKVGFRIKANENANTVTLYSPTSYSELHKDITNLQGNVNSLNSSVDVLNTKVIDIVKNVVTEQKTTQQTIWMGLSVESGQYLIINGTSGSHGTHLVGKKSDNTEEQISDNNFSGYNNQKINITSNYKDIGFWSGSNNPSISVTITLVSKLSDLESKVNSLLPLLPTDIDSFNNVSFNRERISLFMDMYKLKVVDKMNRLVVSFNGDSIIGSQLDNITKSDEYYTGDFPPNMSKMIMARQFLDEYQFENADVAYRNIIHSDWVKSTGAFAISNGKDEPDMTFNEIEVYGTENIGDTAQITVTGYTYFKLIWSEYKAASKFQVLCSVNGGNFNPFTGIPEYIEVASGSRCMQKYAVVKLNPENTYIFKVIATEHPNDILLWGCEMWNNPRLDVVVEAFSGTTARNIVLQGQLEAYHSDWHTPALVVSDILSINDNAFIIGSDQTIDQWMTSNKTIYNRVLDNGISLLLFTPWQTTGQNNLVKMSSKVAIQNDLPYINIQKKQSYIRPSSNLYGPDGLHLSDYGNTYYYDELKRVLNDN